MEEITIRRILPEDNAAIANIIRDVLTEFGANKPGTVFYDPTTNDLFTLFQQPNSCYFIASLNDTIVGGAGIFPTAGLPDNCCELVKLYLSKNARGRGHGKLLMQECFTKAKEMGFEKLYLETMPELNIAVGLYEQQGFTYLTGPMGKSGHFGCNIWMVKNL